MAERARQNLEEHAKQTSEGLYAEDSEGEVGDMRSLVDRLFGQNTSRGEQASSSTSQAVYPTGLNPIELPKSRQRATTRKGTKREGDEPEGVPRRIRAKSQPPIGTVAEAKPRGRPKGSANKPKS